MDSLITALESAAYFAPRRGHIAVDHRIDDAAISVALRASANGVPARAVGILLTPHEQLLQYAGDRDAIRGTIERLALVDHAGFGAAYRALATQPAVANVSVPLPYGIHRDDARFVHGVLGHAYDWSR
jgi:hypothetical protein